MRQELLSPATVQKDRKRVAVETAAAWYIFRQGAKDRNRAGNTRAAWAGSCL